VFFGAHVVVGFWLGASDVAKGGRHGDGTFQIICCLEFALAHFFVLERMWSAEEVLALACSIDLFFDLF